MIPVGGQLEGAVARPAAGQDGDAATVAPGITKPQLLQSSTYVEAAQAGTNTEEGDRLLRVGRWHPIVQGLVLLFGPRPGRRMFKSLAGVAGR